MIRNTLNNTYKQIIAKVDKRRVWVNNNRNNNKK